MIFRQILITLLVFTPAAAVAQDRLALQPDPGAWPVGTAQELTYPPGSMQADLQSNSITVQSPDNASTRWRLTVRTEGSSEMRVGCYERARRFGAPERPEIDFSFGSGGCSRAFGRFRVHELVTDEAGEITSLAIDFNQQCENYGRAVAGQIRFNSSVPISTEFPRAVIEPSGSLSFIAAPGAIGGGATGASRRFDLDRATLSVQGNFDNGASFVYRGPLAPQPESRWNLDFAAPGNVPLTAGTYPIATRFPFQGPEEAGLNFDYNSSGCNTLQGSFAITDILMDGLDNIPLLMNAAFDQRCPNSSGPLTEGTLVFQANIIGPTGFGDDQLLFASGFETGKQPPAASSFYNPTCE